MKDEVAKKNEGADDSVYEKYQPLADSLAKAAGEAPAGKDNGAEESKDEGNKDAGAAKVLNL